MKSEYETELRFMERGIVINLLYEALERKEESIVFKDRYTESNVEYVERLIRKLERLK